MKWAKSETLEWCVLLELWRLDKLSDTSLATPEDVVVVADDAASTCARMDASLDILASRRSWRRA